MITFVAGCAVPVAPTGGPPDREPPTIVSIVPANGTVNVSSTTIEISFNEYITEATFQQALSITPDPVTRPEIRWKKRTVEIELRDELEPNTTYILTIDTKLRDSHGVNLTAPITQAFSTGPEINRGIIQGKVAEPLRGDGLAAIQIFAYPLPESGRLDSLPPRPLYHTETNASGVFALEYLSYRPYFVLGVVDRNGNRRPDNQETIALPPVYSIIADSAGQQIDHPWVATVLDTVAPTIRRVESVDAQLIAVRYSEDVLLPDAPSPTPWTIGDSLQQRQVAVRSVYQLPEDPRQVLLHTARLHPGSYSLSPGVVTDSTGNTSLPSTRSFRITSVVEPDSVRFLSFIPPSEQPGAATLHPSTRVGVLFDRPMASDAVRGRIQVEDTAGVALDYEVDSPDGVRHHVRVSAAVDGGPFRIVVPTADESEADTMAIGEFVYLTSRDLGGIVGVVENVGADSVVYVDAVREPDGFVVGSTVVKSDGAFTVGELRAGGYILRVRRDDNGNGRWDGGSLNPFSPAEPLFWRADSVRVRARWETDIDTIKTSITDI